MDINELSGWGISKQIAEIVENGFSFDEETGEVFFTTDDLDKLEDALEDKIESLAGIYQMYISKANAFKIRSKEVAEAGKSFEKKADNLKRYIDNLMQANNKDKLEAGDKKISYRKSVSSEITDEVALRQYINENDERKERYYKFNEPELRKTELANAIKETKTVTEQGETHYELEIPGFKLVENKNIQIK